MRELVDILTDVKSRIAAAAARAGRNAAEVKLVAVTKTHGVETVDEAVRSGLSIIGENKVQEAVWKKAGAAAGPSWHLIGHLQGNKVRAALETFDYFHSVDSVKLAERMNAIADELGLSPRILLEVNVSGEKSKSGMKIEEAEIALRHIAEHCPRLTVEGFMTMAPFSEQSEDSRGYFRRLRQLRDDLERRLKIALPELSMGMSGDFEVAIEEGATFVRLGTILFGERPKLKAVRASEGGDADAGAPGGLDSYSGAGPTVKVLD